MYFPKLTSLLRLAILIGLITSVLFLALSQAAWATPQQQQRPRSTVTTPRPTPEDRPDRDDNDDDDDNRKESAPGCPTSDEQGIAPGSGTTMEICVPNGHKAAVGFPPDIANAPQTAKIVAVEPRILPPAPGLSVVAAARTSLHDPAGTELKDTQGKKIAVAFRLTSTDLALAGGDPNNIVILWYDEARGAWVALQTYVYPEAGVAFVQVPFTGTFVLAIRTPAPPASP